MSYSSEMFSSSSYRKIFGDSPRLSGRMPVSGHRVSSYRSYGAAKLASMPDTDLAQGTAITNEMKIIRTNEKEQLQGLNDRFVAFIEKVRGLERQNRALEAEASALRQRQAEPSRLRALYEREMYDLRTKLEELTQERSRARLDCERLHEALERAGEELREQSRLREEAEGGLRGCRREVDDSTLARMELERKVEALLDEIAFLRKVHEEELQELQASLQAAQVCVEMDLSKPDLSVALKDIRVQYEELSSRNQQQAEDWYRSKFASVTEVAARNNDAIKQAKDELSEYRRQVQARSLEVEALRGHNEALERQMAEMEDRHGGEVSELQEMIQQLENALRTTKGEMSNHLREYQELLNVKMALDIEIAAYRKLLEGEECRLSNVSGALLQPAYSSISYTSGRTYTLGAYRRGIAKSETEEEEEEAEAEAEAEEKEEEEAEEGGQEEEAGEEEEGEGEGEAEKEGEGEEEEEEGKDEAEEGQEQEEGEAEVENGEVEEEEEEEEEKEEKEEKVEKEEKKEKKEDKQKEEETEKKKKTESKENDSKMESKKEKDESKAEKGSATKSK